MLRAIKLVSALGRHESKVLRLKLKVQSLRFKAERVEDEYVKYEVEV